jgi:hypothetical protein
MQYPAKAFYEEATLKFVIFAFRKFRGQA